MEAIDSITHFKFCRYDFDPETGSVLTEPALITDKSCVSKLREGMKDLSERDICHVDPGQARFLLSAHYPDQRSRVFEVVKNYVLADDCCYFSRSGKLWQALEEIYGQ